jgi:tetratricopeptide (TPR) repeat protein
LPDEWAGTQSNLGNAYLLRVSGERADNLERAIAAHEAALTVLTHEAQPWDWARTQNNLGNAYGTRIRGDRANNLEKAIVAYKAALTVRMRDTQPRDHLQTGPLLGRALLAKRDWNGALTGFLSARDAFLVLFGQGLDDVEASAVIEEAGPLFSDAAFAAAQTGDARLTLSLLSQGRARLMAVALRQQGLKLSAAQHARHETLKAEIRQLSRVVDAATGAERFAALTRLTALRGELSDLVKAGLADTAPNSVLAQLGAMLPAGGALVAPIVTNQGGKLLIATPGKGTPRLGVVDLPQLTTARVQELIGGADAGGWLRAFALQNEEGRASEWLTAIESIGPELWQAVGGPLHMALAAHGVRPGARLYCMPPGALGLLPMGLAKGRPVGPAPR